MAGLVSVRASQTFTPAQAPDYTAFLKAALNKLRTYCNNNASNYAAFQTQVDIDLPTGNFILSASARVYPNAFASLRDAEQALGVDTYTIVNA